jgi:hypothetical protein
MGEIDMKLYEMNMKIGGTGVKLGKTLKLGEISMKLYEMKMGETRVKLGEI